MPCGGLDYGYRRPSKEIEARRAALVAKWKAKGCSPNKIGKLVNRRINSKRQYW